jgi:hypothetical protein
MAAPETKSVNEEQVTVVRFLYLSQSEVPVSGGTIVGGKMG